MRAGRRPPPAGAAASPPAAGGWGGHRPRALHTGLAPPASRGALSRSAPVSPVRPGGLSGAPLPPVRGALSALPPLRSPGAAGGGTAGAATGVGTAAEAGAGWRKPRRQPPRAATSAGFYEAPPIGRFATPVQVARAAARELAEDADDEDDPRRWRGAQAGGADRKRRQHHGRRQHARHHHRHDDGDGGGVDVGPADGKHHHHHHNHHRHHRHHQDDRQGRGKRLAAPTVLPPRSKSTPPRRSRHGARRKAREQEPPPVDTWEEKLFSKARHGRVEQVVAMLEQRHADADITDRFGNTILILAAQNGNKNLVRAMLRRGANVNHENKRGYTALWFAQSYHYGEVATYLERKGARAAGE